MGTTVKLEEIAEWATIEGPFKLKNHVDFYSGGYYIGTVKNSGGGCNETDKANAALITHYLKEFPKLLEVVKYAAEELPKMRARHENLAKQTMIEEWASAAFKSASNVEVPE